MTREMISTSKDTHIAKHLAPEKRTQRGTAARRSLSSGHDLLFNSSKVLFEEDYELDGKRSYIFIKIKDTARGSCE